MKQPQHAPDAGSSAAGRCIVTVTIDTEQIRCGFALEKPPVLERDWDAGAYIEQRTAAYREALEAPSLCVTTGVLIVDLRIVAHDTASTPSDAGSVECPACAGDRVRIDAIGETDPARLESLRDAVVDALRPVRGDAGAWRRCLRPAYFERHRAWRGRVGGPIQH